MNKKQIENETEFIKEISNLSTDHQQLLSLYFLENLTQKEIAARLNQSYAVVRNRLIKGIYLWKKSKEII